MAIPLLSRVPVSRRAWRWLARAALLAVLVPVVLQWVVAYLVGSDARILPPQLLAAKNLLIVTAHPDDECLFFAPSILGVLDRNRAVTGGLLVMSTGNNYGLGETRVAELQNSCKALGIHPKRCVALNRPELQDNPKVWWDTELIAGIVHEHVRNWDIDACAAFETPKAKLKAKNSTEPAPDQAPGKSTAGTELTPLQIVTFDEGGVSGHVNHRAVSAAVSSYAATHPDAPVAFTLTTTSLLRKYTFLGDMPLTALPFSWRILGALSYPARTTAEPHHGRRALVANTWDRYLKTRHAFAQHPSQYTWDRHLYMVVSRYVWFNDLKRVARVEQQQHQQQQQARDRATDTT